MYDNINLSKELIRQLAHDFYETLIKHIREQEEQETKEECEREGGERDEHERSEH